MKKFKALSMIFIIALGACQKGVDVSNPNPSVTPTGNSIQLCADGTLSCYVPEGITTLPSVAFEQCVKSCLQAKGCGTWDSAPQSCSQYGDCSNQCDAFSTNGSLGNLPASDELPIPEEPRKAFEVKVEGCIDSMALTEFHFRGAEFSFDTKDEGQGSAKATAAFNFATGGIGSLFQQMRKEKRIGRHEACDKKYKNKIHVTFTPVGATSVELNGSSVAVTPFANAAAIELDCKMTHTVSCGLPQQIRDELDMRQIAWTLKDIAKLDLGIKIYGDWMFVNNNIPYGDTIVMVYPMGVTPVHEEVKMVVFASAK